VLRATAIHGDAYNYTNTVIERRDYKVTILCNKHGELKHICELERRIIKNNKEFRYTPKIPFGGQTECFEKVNF
jgi:hypothetical protein